MESRAPAGRATRSIGSSTRPCKRHGLSPAPEADRRTLIRRLTFDLTGLPPDPGRGRAFLADPSPDAYERLVDRLLASPHYGERWARHWLDLVRYAETAGHEFDYEILERLPLSRLRDPRLQRRPAVRPVRDRAGRRRPARAAPPASRSLGFNESILGTGFFFLGEGTHSPVDVREEEMRRIDNQIDVFSKTFLGLTVACARCHDHKFDPITIEGLLRPGRLPPQLAASAGVHRSSRADRRPRRAGCRSSRRRSGRSSLEAGPAAIAGRERTPCSEPLDRRRPADDASSSVFEIFNRDGFDGWSVTGDAFGDRPHAAGDFRLDLPAQSAPG